MKKLIGNLKRVELIIFFASFLQRLLIIFFSKSYENIVLWEYSAVAQSILSKEGFVFRYMGTLYYSYLQPLYPLLCALIYKIFGFNNFFVLIFQCLISAGLSTIIFLIAQKFFGKTIGVIAALLVMFHPGLIIYSTKYVHVLIFDAFFFCLLVFTFLRLSKQCSIKNKIIAGITLGLCILTRATVIFFIPLAIVWLLFNLRGLIRKKVVTIISIISIAIIVISPWIIRNYLHYKRLIPICANSWELLWRGNNPKATGALSYGDDKTYYDFLPKGIFAMPEDAQNMRLREEVLKFLREDPIKALRLYFKKAYYFFWFSEFSGRNYNKDWLGVYKIYYLVVLITFIYALIQIFGFKEYQNLRSPSLLIMMLICSVSLGQSLFYVEGRHRWEIEPLILIFSSFSIFEAIRLLNLQIINFISRKKIKEV